MRVEHPALHDDRLFDLAEVRAVFRAEYDCPGLAVVAAKEEIPHRKCSDFRPISQSRPVRMSHSHLAREDDRIGRIRLLAQPFEGGVRAPCAGPRRKSEACSQADQDTQEDKRPPAATNISPRPECGCPGAVPPLHLHTVEAMA